MFFEYYIFSHHEIEKAGYHPCKNIAYKCAPAEDSLKQQQESHLDQENAYTGSVIAQEALEKSRTVMLLNTVIPDQEI